MLERLLCNAPVLAYTDRAIGHEFVSDVVVVPPISSFQAHHDQSAIYMICTGKVCKKRHPEHVSFAPTGVGVGVLAGSCQKECTPRKNDGTGEKVKLTPLITQNTVNIKIV